MTTEIVGMDFQPLFAATSLAVSTWRFPRSPSPRNGWDCNPLTQPYYDADMGIAARKEGLVKLLADQAR